MDTLAHGISASLAGNHRNGDASNALQLKERKLMFQSGYMYMMSLMPMIKHSKKLSHWVTAEIISARSEKVCIWIRNIIVALARFIPLIFFLTSFISEFNIKSYKYFCCTYVTFYVTYT